MSKPSVGPPQRILVVDDEPCVCDAVKLMLEVDAHNVETAGDAKEALGVYKKGKFDIVITDWKMKEMNGVELADAIKAIDPRQPVVMITAHAEILQGSGTPLKSVDALVPKPFPQDDLRQAIAKVTGKSK